MIITTEHHARDSVPAHIRLRNTVWKYNSFEVRDYSLSYYQQAKRLVEHTYKGKYASHGRQATLGEEAENIWYQIG